MIDRKYCGGYMLENIGDRFSNIKKLQLWGIVFIFWCFWGNLFYAYVMPSYSIQEQNLNRELEAISILQSEDLQMGRWQGLKIGSYRIPFKASNEYVDIPNYEKRVRAGLLANGWRYGGDHSYNQQANGPYYEKGHYICGIKTEKDELVLYLGYKHFWSELDLFDAAS